MPDWWETAWFGGITNARPEEDTDGDGRTQREELQAGTSPIEATEALAITGVTPPRGDRGVEVAWSSVAERRYEIRQSTSSTHWTLTHAGIAGTPPTNRLSVPWAKDATSMLFRVETGRFP